MIRLVVLLSALGTIGATAPAAPGDKLVETLSRSGKWVANYDHDSCTVVAPMGEGNGGAAVKFTRYEPGDDFDLTLVGNRFAESAVRVEGTAEFGLGGKPIPVYAFAGNTEKYPVLVFDSMRVDGWRAKRLNEVGPVITPEQEARVTGMTLTLRGKPALRLEFGSLTMPMAAMRKCMDELVKRWGYDPAQQAAAQRHVAPVTRPQTWLRWEDYPFKAMRRGHNGIVQLRLDVDPEGKVTGCSVLARTKPDDFADKACAAIAKRARLRPALDAQGKPMRAFWVGNVRWIA